MRVILQENVSNLGKIGDRVAVRRGFARNFLIPMGKAVFETPENLAQFEKQRAEFEKKAASALKEAQDRAEQLQNKTVTINAQAGDEGKLFGSIGPREAASALSDAGIKVAKSEIRMPRGPIRQVGEYEIGVQLHPEVVVPIKLVVAAAV